VNAASKLDIAERTDLLCFLMLAQLIDYARTGEWLRTDQAVEATRIWSAFSSTDCDWLERTSRGRHPRNKKAARGHWAYSGLDQFRLKTEHRASPRDESELHSLIRSEIASTAASCATILMYCACVRQSPAAFW
jgi:hypothetical protein